MQTIGTLADVLEKIDRKNDMRKSNTFFLDEQSTPDIGFENKQLYETSP